jgi:hypothetical protein
MKEKEIGRICRAHERNMRANIEYKYKILSENGRGVDLS